MRRTIASLLFLMGAIFASAQELDLRFIALLEWSEELSVKGKFWNETCAADQTKEGCKMFRAVLSEQYTLFAEAALRYTQTDTDCAGVLRVKVIQHQVAIAIHNKECAGSEQTPQCVGEQAKLKENAVQIKKEMDECSNAKNEKI